MKKIILALLILSSGAYAQSGKHEKIKALKTAYITEKLALTPKEAEAFWPVYNHFDDKLHDLRKQQRSEIFKKLRGGIENLSDAEANALIDKGLSLESQQLELQKQMITGLRKVISPKKK
jgi:hypothetical protein